MWQAYLHNHKGAERISDHQLNPNNQTRATRAVQGWNPAAQLPEQLCGSSYRQTGGVTAYRDMGLIIGKEHLGIVQDSFWGVGDEPKTRRRRDWGSVGNKHGKTEGGACVCVGVRTNNWNGLWVSAMWVKVPATGAVQWTDWGCVCVPSMLLQAHWECLLSLLSAWTWGHGAAAALPLSHHSEWQGVPCHTYRLDKE